MNFIDWWEREGRSQFKGRDVVDVASVAWAKALEQRADVLRESIYKQALQQLSHCDLNDGNCGSVEIAGKRVRNIARMALADAESQSNSERQS